MRYLVLILFLASCTTQRKVEAWMDKNEPKAAAICNEMFPIVETHDTTYVHDTSYVMDIRNTTEYIEREVKVGCDSVTATKVIERIRTMPAPPAQTKVVTRTVESTAKLVILQDQLDKTKIKLASATTERNWLFWLLLIACAWIFRKPFIRMWNAEN